MEFIQCKSCDTIIAIKDLLIPFSESLLASANSHNTIRGNDICATCAEIIGKSQEETKINMDTPLYGEKQ